MTKTRMSTSTALLADIGIGAVAGLVASKVTEYAQELLYLAMPESVREAEERVRPGDPSQVAARKLTEAVGISAGEQQIKGAGTAVHFGLGASWGPVYCLLRRYSGMEPAGAALVTGATLSLVVDEALTPAMKFSAPSRAYPLLTHLRGLTSHLIFGAVVAATAEILYRATRTAPPDQASA